MQVGDLVAVAIAGAAYAVLIIVGLIDIFRKDQGELYGFDE